MLIQVAIGSKKAYFAIVTKINFQANRWDKKSHIRCQNNDKDKDGRFDQSFDFKHSERRAGWCW